ncbi:MAG: hypothetical protein ABWY08_13125 [Comamonas sp.]
MQWPGPVIQEKRRSWTAVYQGKTLMLLPDFDDRILFKGKPRATAQAVLRNAAKSCARQVGVLRCHAST